MAQLYMSALPHSESWPLLYTLMMTMMTKLQRAVEHTPLSKHHESRRHLGSGIDPTHPDRPRPSPFLIHWGLRLYQSAETLISLTSPPPPPVPYKSLERLSLLPSIFHAHWGAEEEAASCFSPRLISPTHAKVTHWNKISKRFCYIQHSMFCWGIKQLSVKGKNGESWVCGGSCAKTKVAK